MKINFKIGFSLAELMVVLLLVSLLIAALVPIVTKKHLNLPKRSEHGSYMCYYKDGKLYEKKTINRYNGQSEEKQVDNCVFTPPSKALYFQISAVGGGGGGGDSGYTGGNLHAVWKELETISPFNLTQEEITKRHIIYNGKGYFPPNTSEGDLSATLYSYAMSYGSRKGGDVGYMSCSISSGGGEYYNTTGTTGSIPECPKSCSECPSGKTYSCSWSGNFYTAPGGSEWSPGKPYDCDCEITTNTVKHDPKEVCDEYNYTEKIEYACKGSSSFSSTPPSADECGARGCCSTKRTKVQGTCKTSHIQEFPDTTVKTRTCDTCYTEGSWVPAGEPSYHSGSWSGTCCSDCPDDKVISNEACEKKRKELLDAQKSAGTTWGGKAYCYYASGFTHSFSSGTYTGSGGKAGSGVKCKKQVPKDKVYGLNIINDVAARNEGKDGEHYYPKSVNSFSPASVCAQSGSTLCADGDFSVNCNAGGDWTNVLYSLLTISDGSTSYSAKAYNAPLSGTGACTTGITTGGKGTVTKVTYNNSNIVISDNTVSESLCSDDKTFSSDQLCPATTAYDDVVRGTDGSNGQCAEESESVSSFCSIPSSQTTAYCMQHHEGFVVGKDKTTGTNINVAEYEPGYGSLKPGYRYRSMYNENYLQYGNAGAPGEVKTIVVRSLKNMDTTIKIGRGGAGGVKGSGADGQDGSATSMGQIIIADGGKGGEGNLITQTDILPGYDSAAYSAGELVKTSGQSEGALAKASGFLTNMFSYLKSLKEDTYDEIFNGKGRGGKGGGVNHNCWAGQFVVWFEGQILNKTSIFNGTAGSSYYPDPTKLLGDSGYWKAVPSDAAGYVPDTCKTDFELIEAESGTDGAIMIKW